MRGGRFGFAPAPLERTRHLQRLGPRAAKTEHRSQNLDHRAGTAASNVFDPIHILATEGTGGTRTVVVGMPPFVETSQSEEVANGEPGNGPSKARSHLVGSYLPKPGARFLRRVQLAPDGFTRLDPFADEVPPRWGSAEVERAG